MLMNRSYGRGLSLHCIGCEDFRLQAARRLPSERGKRNTGNCPYGAPSASSHWRDLGIARIPSPSLRPHRAIGTFVIPSTSPRTRNP